VDVFLKHGVYKTYIRPHLEFRIQARSPHFSKDIDVLERVQKAVTNLVLKLRKYSYQERLKEATENAGVAKMQGGGEIAGVENTAQTAGVENAGVTSMESQNSRYVTLIQVGYNSQ